MVCEPTAPAWARRSCLLPRQTDCPPASSAAMTVAVELTFETVDHVVGGGYTGLGGGLRRPDRAVTRATQEYHRAIVAGRNVLQQVGHEVLVGLAVGSVPFDVDDIAAQAGQVRYADEAPFGVGAYIDQNRLGV